MLDTLLVLHEGEVMFVPATQGGEWFDVFLHMQILDICDEWAHSDSGYHLRIPVARADGGRVF